jgi:predicted SprT family Zn-dependent metalloprotease
MIPIVRSKPEHPEEEKIEGPFNYCDACGAKILEPKTIEREFRGLPHFFCGESCHSRFLKIHPK